MSQQMKIVLAVIAAAGDGQLQRMAKVADIVEKAKADINAFGEGVTVTVETSTYTPRPVGQQRKPRTPAANGAQTAAATPPTPPILKAAEEPAKANTEAKAAQAPWAGNAQKAG